MSEDIDFDLQELKHVVAPRDRQRHWKFFAGGVAAAAVIAFGYWLYSRNLEWTDDAFIDADISVVSPKVSGQVSKILVSDNQMVKQGDLLIELDPVDYKVRLDQSKAAVSAAQAEADRSKADAARNKRLFKREQISRQAYDHTAADANVGQAKVDLARQQLTAAQLNLSYTKITALQSGKITHRSVNVANFVEVGRPLMAIVPDEVFVTANFKENQVSRIKAGDRVSISIDAFPGRKFKAHVDSIQAGTGDHFSLLPPENATGNYVKVVQRVPVKIVFDESTKGFSLVPGMSVVPTVQIR